MSDADTTNDDSNMKTATDLVDEVLDDSDELEASNKIADELSSLQTLAERYSDSLDKLKEKQKELRESLKNIFENDQELSQVEDQVAQIVTEVKQRKQALDGSPEVRKLKMKLNELKEEMKEIEETLNGHLLQIFQMTGVTSFDTSEGDQREYVLKARVKPKRASTS